MPRQEQDVDPSNHGTAVLTKPGWKNNPGAKGEEERRKGNHPVRSGPGGHGGHGGGAEQLRNARKGGDGEDVATTKYANDTKDGRWGSTSRRSAGMGNRVRWKRVTTRSGADLEDTEEEEGLLRNTRRTRNGGRGRRGNYEIRERHESRLVGIDVPAIRGHGKSGLMEEGHHPVRGGPGGRGGRRGVSVVPAMFAGSGYGMAWKRQNEP